MAAQQQGDWDAHQSKKDSAKSAWKSVAAIATLAGGAAGALSGYFLAPFGEKAQEVGQAIVDRGTLPLDYRVSSEESYATRAWLPNITLDAAQKASLLSDDKGDVMGAVEEMGGFLQGGRVVVIELWGNRDKPISLVDIEPHKECDTAGDGATVVIAQEDRRGAGSATGVVELLELTVGGLNEELIRQRTEFKAGEATADGDTAAVTTTGVDVTRHRYFKGDNPVILKDEPFTMRVNLYSEEEVCDVTFDATVSVDGEQETFPLEIEGGPIKVGPGVDPFEMVTGPAYIAGDVCDDFVETTPENIAGWVGKDNCAVPPQPAPTASPSRGGDEELFAPVDAVPEATDSPFAPVDIPEGLLDDTDGNG